MKKTWKFKKVSNVINESEMVTTVNDEPAPAYIINCPIL